MEWWKTLFSSEDYLKIFHPYITDEKTQEEVNFIIENVRFDTASKILDLCCGTGRHSIELARRGYKVTGVDWSHYYLQNARKIAAIKEVELDFRQSDMRCLEYDSDFDVVINMFTSFGYFDNEDDNEKTIQQIYKVLKPKGWFFFDFINLAQLLRFPTPLINYQDPSSGLTIMRERFLDLFTWRLNEKCTVHGENTNKEYWISYRLYTLAEFVYLLKRNGLEFRQAFGDFDGRNCCSNFPPRMIIISQKV